MNVVTGFVITYLALSVYGLPSPQIVGGNDALDGFHPYQVSLRTGSLPSSHYCGGVIISEYFILTAAQCLEGVENPYSIYAFVGSNHLDEGIKYQAKDVIIHAGYNKLLDMNNIGLVRVQKPIEFNKNVKPIALPIEDHNYDNYPIIATGWGKLAGADGRFPNDLQVIILKGYNHENCSTSSVKKTHICTLAMDGQGLCHHDDGGPLVADGYLVGLITFDINSQCNTGIPNKSTKIFPYKSWIGYYTGVQ